MRPITGKELCRRLNSDNMNVRIRSSLFLLGAFAMINQCWGAPATSEIRPWTDYRTIMWIGDSAYKKPEKVPLFFQRLREMGVNTAMVYGDGRTQVVLSNKFPYYVENVINRGLCLKWNSKVTDWDKFVTAWAKNGRQESALVRDYCLDDPQWRSWARREAENIARKNMPNEPLAYDIRDELSTTTSANPFDYDFNPIALNSFREWLKTQYPTLEVLNAEWETQFGSWEEVKPFTSDQIKNRMGSGDAKPRGNPDWQDVQNLKFEPQAARKNPTRWNFSPWADFRTYMDISLARALDDIRQASHRVDPRTPVGIEGTQMPHAFGGYDLWRMSKALDWVEPYDIGCSREIFGSFMPGKTVVCTVFEKESNPALRRLWHLLLQGDKGCIIWWSEDCIDWKSEDYALTAKAKTLAPVMQEMTSPLAQVFLLAERQYDPILLLYSQPSIQVDWLIESTIDGSTWLRRFSSFESDYNRMAKVRNSWLKAFQDLGYSPRFISTEQLSQGFEKPSVLVLPTCLALSEQEAKDIQKVLASGGLVYSDGAPGLFDEHGKLRASGPLDKTFLPAISQKRVYANAQSRSGDIVEYARQRLNATAKQDWAEWIAQGIKDKQGIKPEVQVPLESRTRVYRYKLGDARLVAFERNINYHMSEELKQAGGNEALEKPVEIEATLAQAAHIYDLRAGKYLGKAQQIRVQLEPWKPSLYALLPEKVAEEDVLQRLLSAKSVAQ